MEKALIFDCDGVLAETEEHGHRPAFNRMWREFGVPWQWSVEEYGRKLKIAGGKERMASLFDDPEFLRVFTPPADPRRRRELIADWHWRKRAIYAEFVNSGKVPPRSGVKRLAEEALARGWKVAVASTSAQDSVEAVLYHVMGAETASRFSLVLAGDIVPSKKPAPDLYLLAAARLNIAPANCVVTEDSNIGVTAATAAGMCSVVTVSGYTRNEDFSQASIVLTCLGDPGGEVCRVLANRSSARPGAWFTVQDLEAVHASSGTLQSPAVPSESPHRTS